MGRIVARSWEAPECVSSWCAAALEMPGLSLLCEQPVVGVEIEVFVPSTPKPKPQPTRNHLNADADASSGTTPNVSSSASAPYADRRSSEGGGSSVVRGSGADRPAEVRTPLRTLNLLNPN